MFAVANLALRRYLRDRSNFFFVFVLPFLIIFFVGYTTGSSEASRIAAVGADTDIGASVLSHLEPDRVDVFDNADDAIRAVGDGNAAAVVVFPADPSTQIQFLARSGTALDVRTDIGNAIDIENQRIVINRQAARVGATGETVEATRQQVGVVPVVDETIGTVVCGGLADLDAAALTQLILFMFLAALTASSFVVQDRTLGMARRKASTPISITRLVVGETIGRFWIAMFQGILIVAVTGLVFDVGWGNPAATTAVLALFGLVATGVGVLLGTVLDNPEGANYAGIMIGLVLAALGGAMAPVEIFPDAMQTVARCTPHYWAIEGLQTSLTGGGVTDLARPLGVLAAMAAVVLALSTTLYRRRTFTTR